MAAEPKPATRPIWAESGDTTSPADPKKSLGWTLEIPPYEYFNWILNALARFVAHVNESGVPEWDAATSYDVDAYCKGSDGDLYRSITNGNANNDPASVPGKQFWRNALVAKITSQSSITNNGFAPIDINDISILLSNGAGPFQLTQGSFTHPELTTIRNDLISQWLAEVEAP